jgi:putative sterol carrier protein
MLHYGCSKLIDLKSYTEEAQNHADFIMVASAPVWKNILTKADKFVAAFMARRIKLEKGNPVKALALEPYAGTIVASLTQVELVFPDDLSPEELEEFKISFAEYRAKAGV